MVPNRTLVCTILTLALCAPAALAQTPEAQAAQEASRVARDAAREAARVGQEVAKQLTEQLRHLDPEQGAEARGEAFTDKLSRVVKAPDPVTVLVQNFSGNVTVSAGTAHEVRIDATKRTRSHNAAEAKERLDATTVSIEERPGRVEIRAVGQKGRHGRYDVASVDFDLVVPAGASLELKSVSGDLSMLAVKGRVSADTVSGNITAGALGSDATLRTVSGDVIVNASAVTGDVTANSVSGDVTAKGLKARAVSASTVSGDVALRDASCERAVVKSVSGNLEFAGPLAKAARYELKSHSGDVRIVVDGKVGFALDAATWSGALNSELPLKSTAPADEGGAGFKRRTLQGTFGDASGQIEMTSFSGSVTVAKAK
jgi:DUF4097 and DUF4098 domain-containing protein YvlB